MANIFGYVAGGMGIAATAGTIALFIVCLL